MSVPGGIVSDRLYSLAEVTIFLDCTPRWARELIYRRQLRATRIGTRLYVSGEVLILFRKGWKPRKRTWKYHPRTRQPAGVAA